MRYGFVLPWGDARTAADLAAIAERHGWDGFFVWEPVWGVDAWIALAAAAMTTDRIKLGTMLTPLPRRRPWDLASQTATLDNLSGGRLILSVGLGATHAGWLAFEPDPGRRIRAQLLDEGLDVLTGLWAGQPFDYDGRHHQITSTDFMPPPPPVQQPRIPIWVVGGWPSVRSMRRAARYDGWLPNILPSVGKSDGTGTAGGAGQDDSAAPGRPTPEHVRAGAAWIRDFRTVEGLDSAEGYDIISEGTTPDDDPATARAIVQPWREAGATWWIEADWSVARDAVADYARARLTAGPPSVSQRSREEDW